MIVFKKIKFSETEEVIESKVAEFLIKNYSGVSDENFDENVFMNTNPTFQHFSKVFDEITEYAYENKEKEYFLVVTRKELWNDFTKVLIDSCVEFVDEDIQDSFLQNEIDNEIFQTSANLYMLKHMTVDEVLDKMNKYGKKYLTDIDYEILKKAKNLS